MGELHLDIYVEWMRCKYGVTCSTSRLQAMFHETVTECVEFVYTYKKQMGSAGQYVHVTRHIEPVEMDTKSRNDTIFESVVMGRNMPSNHIPVVKKGFYKVLKKGVLSRNPISSICMVLCDGSFHAVNLSELVTQGCPSIQSKEK